MDFKSELLAIFYPLLKNELTYQEIEQLLEKPKQRGFGDFAFPCFPLAKLRKQSPKDIALNLAGEIQSDLIEKVEPVGGYVNIFLNKKKITKVVISEILTEKEKYGSHNIGNGGVITIDMSSPNIAKPFSMGHLRSTVIGNSISLILEKCGYKVVKINHLGDWGTQFGKLISAYKHWGEERKLKENPIQELLKLYIKFHEEAEKNPELEEEGRSWFKKLEDGDQEARSLWQWFRDESLKEFNRIYKLLQIEFDSTAGEAFYNDKMESVVEMLKNKNLLMESDNALVVYLDDLDMPPCLIKRSDGATLYATRDLAAAIYRKNTYHFVKSLYVVGNEQTLHFKQWKAVLKKAGFPWAEDIHHIAFGMIRKDGKKMSTRKGQVVFLEDVLNEAIQLALTNIKSKNPNLQNKEMVANQVGVGAIVFHDLKHYRMNDIDFSLEEITRFEGETGPYVQYTNARANSILRKANIYLNEIPGDFQLDREKEWEVITLLNDFPQIVKHAYEKFDPSMIAKYTIHLSQAFNKYYSQVRILQNDNLMKSRLSLTKAVTIVLTEGLRLLGINAPEEM
jgi:arginyl-tRNA synthetase